MEATVAPTSQAAPPPRLRDKYEQDVLPALTQKFGYSTPMEAPRLEKITLNMGLGKEKQDKRSFELAQEQLAIIAGQQPSVRRARKSVASFKLREGMPVGVSVTLRRARMWEFLDRLISIAVPRIRDFRGLNPRSFDGRGNYSMGVKEQLIFPEIDYDSVDVVRGLDITITTSAKTDLEAFELLLGLGMPFAQEGGNYAEETALKIDIEIKGPWLHTILFEIPMLAIVNEVYFCNTQQEPDYSEGRGRLVEKMKLLGARPEFADCKIADYGTRRRFSKQWHEEVILTLKDGLGEQFAGTSNVFYAMKHSLTPLGTMAHEYLQACQALGPRLRDSQIFGFEMWAKEYRGDLGIALSDVYGMQAFLRDFDMYFCKLFDGARHDSGDPFDWGERLLQHYEANRCDPRTKILVFSDALDIPKVLQLYERFRGRCKLAFGVGTNLTNDLGYNPLQIVIKMVRCNGQPVAKLSDSPGKNMCDDKAYLAYLRQVFGIAQPEEEPAK